MPQFYTTVRAFVALALLIVPQRTVFAGDEHVDPWDHLREILLVRHDAEGNLFGDDVLDPLLWEGTRYLREGESHAAAIAALNRVLDPLVEPPGDLVHRALLQNDLRAVFNWSVRLPWWDNPRSAEAEHEALQRRLAPAILKLALS